MGKVGATDLPVYVEEAAAKLYSELSSRFGSIRVEWVHDGKQIWIVQLQQEESLTSGDTIVPGEPATWHYFTVANNLEELRAFIPVAQEQGAGIVLVGNVGLTSHFADILREARIPSRRERKSQRQMSFFDKGK